MAQQYTALSIRAALKRIRATGCLAGFNRATREFRVTVIDKLATGGTVRSTSFHADPQDAVDTAHAIHSMLPPRKAEVPQDAADAVVASPDVPAAFLAWVKANIPVENRTSSGDTLLAQVCWFAACTQADEIHEYSFKERAHAILGGIGPLRTRDDLGLWLDGRDAEGIAELLAAITDFWSKPPTDE